MLKKKTKFVSKSAELTADSVATHRVRKMRLTIFSRVMIAQSTLILLILVVSLFAVGKLRLVSQLNTEALTADASCIKEEKRLLQSFLSEMRNVEKYLLMRDLSFRDESEGNKNDFYDAVSKISYAIDSEREKGLLKEIESLHDSFEQATDLTNLGAQGSETARASLGEGIIERVNELIILRDQAASHKTALARDHAASAAEVMFWLTVFGIAGAFVMAYVHARGISRPLRGLAREMRRIGQGEFFHTAQVDGPTEVVELAQSLNLMVEELEHLDRLKADFTAHVSHELRTPLTAIREGTALLLEEISGPLTKSQREILEVVRNHSKRLFQSISSILDLSKMEAAMMDYEFTMCDLKALIEASVDAVDLIARKGNIKLRSKMVGAIPMLLADERRIQQVMNNLLSNALKFSPTGGEVRVEALTVGDPRRNAASVEIRVSDDGPGIAAGEFQNIFKHFYQSRNQKTKGQQGTGLGLAIARHIVEAHKGSIWAQSEVGCGSTFHVLLPVRTDIESSVQYDIFKAANDG
jgi:two-component system, NtrC family, sensor histidine kinase GlrK